MKKLFNLLFSLKKKFTVKYSVVNYFADLVLDEKLGVEVEKIHSVKRSKELLFDLNSINIQQAEFDFIKLWNIKTNCFRPCPTLNIISIESNNGDNINNELRLF